MNHECSMKALRIILFALASVFYAWLAYRIWKYGITRIVQSSTTVERVGVIVGMTIVSAMTIWVFWRMAPKRRAKNTSQNEQNT